jgi:hypothetical protein
MKLKFFVELLSDFQLFPKIQVEEYIHIIEYQYYTGNPRPPLVTSNSKL